MKTKPRPVGRPREFAGNVRAHLAQEELDYILDLAEREDRPVSRVARQLIVEAIDARLRKARHSR